MPTVTHIIDQNLPIYATGNQTISGVKTFKNRVDIISGHNPFSELPSIINNDTLLHLQSSGKAFLVIEADTDDTDSGELYNPGLVLLQDGRKVEGSLSFHRNTLELVNSWTGDDAIAQGKILLGTKNTGVLAISKDGNVMLSTGINLRNWVSSGTTNHLLIVDGNISGRSLTASVDINNITENFTFSGDWNSKLLTINSPQNITGTIPASFPNGYNVSFVQMGNGQLQITGVGGVIIRQRINSYRTAGQYSIASLLHRANNEYILYGDLI